MEDSPALPPQPPVAPDPLALDLLRQSRVINARLEAALAKVPEASVPSQGAPAPRS